MEHNYIKLSNRSVQIDDIIYVSEVNYNEKEYKYYFDIIYADRNHIRLEYEYIVDDCKQAREDKEMLESCLNYIDIINDYDKK